MNLTQLELVLVGLVIVYIAFFTNPVPLFLQSLFESPVGHALALGGILYVFVSKSLVVGVFLAIAYVMTTKHVSEYMTDGKEEKKPETSKQPTAEGVAKPALHGIVGASMPGEKMRLPSISQKKGTPPPSKLPEVSPPKPLHTQSQETFASF
jgi:hypothetical protein